MNILVIVAHPDDPEFFCGGTVAKWCAEGHSVRYVLVTGGQKGSDVPDMTPECLVALRRVEQVEAASMLGVTDVSFLSYIDGELANTLGLQQELARAIRHHTPDIIITTDPQTLHYGALRVNHNDHRIMGMAVCDAVFPAANNRMYFPELLAKGFAMHPPKEIYFAGPVAPNLIVDISDYVPRKIEAIKKHVSQVKAPDKIDARMQQGLLRITPQGKTYFTESFRRVSL